MYVDAYHHKDSDRIRVVERVNGERVLRESLPRLVFYYTDPKGRHRSIFGDPVEKFQTHRMGKFRAELKAKQADSTLRVFESDINPVFRHLADHYMAAEAPTLHVGFFDIEAGFDAVRGYAPPEDPFNPVTAISLYHGATATMHSLVLCPPTLEPGEAQAIADHFPDTRLFHDERLLLLAFLELIQDIDCLVTWNGEAYDIPYLVNRVRLLLGDEGPRCFCLWDEMPREREYVKFGRPFKSYELIGRVHLDYLLLYQKHNTQQQHSYRLDFIGEIEVGENKVPYEGTLDDLYKKDFERFIGYSRQDVALMVKIDAKKKFIDLANQIAHENCILFKTTMGTVSFVEQAIINEMHKLGFVVPDRKPRDEAEDERTPVAGAYVAKPRVGLHDLIGCVDINSLYPSTIRALNMSPETIFGQVRPAETQALIERRIAEGTPRAEAWDGVFAILEVERMWRRDDRPMTVDFEDGSQAELTGAQLHDLVFDPGNHLCITANGTLFRTDAEGMIPKLLGMWYAERKQLQAEARNNKAKAQASITEEERSEHLRLASFFEQRQYAGKIRLNALYGALLQVHCRFYDERLGQSTTLTGRSIVRHMGAKINEIITGQYDHLGKAIYYQDTDSAFFSCHEAWSGKPEYAGFDWTRANVVMLYDEIADATNATFAAFMAERFNTGAARGGLIKAGRELVASKALFIKKKKYACLCYDVEGTRHDRDGKPGKLKAMGLDLKRADTPKVMQTFLQSLLMKLLTGEAQPAMLADIKEFRAAFAQRPGWDKGAPKKVSNLQAFAAKLDAAVDLLSRESTGRVNMPGHVRASIHWNRLCEMHGDRHATRIADGARIVVCKLRPNAMRMDSVAFPIDQPHLPPWFKELPFDDDAMEAAIIDAKVANLVGVLGWDLSATRERAGDEFFVFGGKSAAVAAPDPEPAAEGEGEGDDAEADAAMGHNNGPAWDDED